MLIMIVLYLLGMVLVGALLAKKRIPPGISTWAAASWAPMSPP